MKNRKDFICIGPLDAAKYKELKDYVINGSMNVVKSPFMNFNRPSDAKSSASTVKVAIFSSFDDDFFGKKPTYSDSTELSKLPTDSKLNVPVSINDEGKFSIKQIPSSPNGGIGKIIVPLEILRKSWRDKFKIIDILNGVNSMLS